MERKGNLNKHPVPLKWLQRLVSITAIMLLTAVTFTLRKTHWKVKMLLSPVYSVPNLSAVLSLHSNLTTLRGKKKNSRVANPLILTFQVAGHLSQVFKGRTQPQVSRLLPHEEHLACLVRQTKYWAGQQPCLLSVYHPQHSSNDSHTQPCHCSTSWAKFLSHLLWYCSSL